MNLSKPYIRISEDEDEEPTADEIGLDFQPDMEYNTPYTTYGEDTFNVGGIISDGDIFDDR